MNEYWNVYFAHFREYYRNCEKTFFKYGDRIIDLTEQQREYVNKEMHLEALVGAPKPQIVNTLLKSNGKENFAYYLIKSLNVDVPVDQLLDGESTFQLLVKSLFRGRDSFAQVYLLQDLYKRGYSSGKTDEQYLREIYKNLKSQSELEIWCVARFACKLNDAEKLERALQKLKVLFTIVSFKLKKPVGIGYPNLLGIANNALLHYREDGALCLQAMKQFGVYEDILARDHKKSFRERLNDFELYKPMQDEEFAAIAKELFPEISLLRQH